NTTYRPYCKVDIGGLNAEAYATTTAKQWVNNSINVSSLTNGTVYDVVVSIRIAPGHSGTTNLYYLTGIAS
ncbi:MAG: hypothetical protein PHH69_03755, partial [Candidatus Omnitrophica bacterium]|nr:hypothetical protein [Candidatus Omnitrophota bacterium]